MLAFRLLPPGYLRGSRKQRPWEGSWLKSTAEPDGDLEGPNVSLVSPGLPGEKGTPGLPGPKGDDGRPGAMGVMGMRGIKGNNESQSTSLTLAPGHLQRHRSGWTGSEFWLCHGLRVTLSKSLHLVQHLFLHPHTRHSRNATFRRAVLRIQWDTYV